VLRMKRGKVKSPVEPIPPKLKKASRENIQRTQHP
jgi:hypothetical protein